MTVIAELLKLLNYNKWLFVIINNIFTLHSFLHVKSTYVKIWKEDGIAMETQKTAPLSELYRLILEETS